MSADSRRSFCTQLGITALLGGVPARAARAAPLASASEPLPGEEPVRSIVPGSPYPTFSRAVRYGKLVFVAGVVGQKPGTRDLVAPEFEPQCRQTLDNLKASVEAAGSRLDLVLKCTVYIAAASDFATFNKLYVEYFPKDPPARSSIVVKELVVPGALLEVDCVTVMP
ncbi:MAG: putative aminoacrylate peracid reductase RutC [Phycisphaerae bacterium]|nr:putative aminoacrylate peracid reductase RutC [Phycisphaerae bacterium]